MAIELEIAPEIGLVDIEVSVADRIAEVIQQLDIPPEHVARVQQILLTAHENGCLEDVVARFEQAHSEVVVQGESQGAAAGNEVTAIAQDAAERRGDRRAAQEVAADENQFSFPWREISQAALFVTIRPLENEQGMAHLLAKQQQQAQMTYA